MFVPQPVVEFRKVPTGFGQPALARFLRAGLKHIHVCQLAAAKGTGEIYSMRPGQDTCGKSAS